MTKRLKSKKNNLTLDSIVERWVNLISTDIEARKRQQESIIKSRKDEKYEIVS